MVLLITQKRVYLNRSKAYSASAKLLLLHRRGSFAFSNPGNKTVDVLIFKLNDWTLAGTIPLATDWQYTEPIVGSYFRVTHSGFPKAGLYEIAQAQTNPDGSVELSMLAEQLQPRLEPQIIHAITPPVLGERRLAIRRLPKQQTFKEMLREVFNKTVLEDEEINPFPPRLINWQVAIEVSDYIESSTTGGSESTSPYDSDANTVINAILATGATLTDNQKTACDNRIKALKTDGIWTKLVAYYGMLGGTAASHAINWKSPGTYDLIWNGSVTHSAQGSQGDGASGYANSQIPLSVFNAQNIHATFYNRSAVAANWGALVTPQNNACYQQGTFWRCARGSGNGGNDSDARASINLFNGHITCNTNATPDISLYLNGSNVTGSRPVGLPDNYNFTYAGSLLLMANNNNGSPINFDSAQIGSFSVGNSLTGTEITANYKSEVTYQTVLGRNV